MENMKQRHAARSALVGGVSDACRRCSCWPQERPYRLAIVDEPLSVLWCYDDLQDPQECKRKLAPPRRLKRGATQRRHSEARMLRRGERQFSRARAGCISRARFHRHSDEANGRVWWVGELRLHASGGSNVVGPCEIYIRRNDAERGQADRDWTVGREYSKVYSTSDVSGHHMRRPCSICGRRTAET